MGRIGLAAIVIGGVMAFIGFQEWRVSSGTKSEPVSVDLAQLEEGKVAENNCIKVGEHVAVYPGCVYAYEGDSQPRSSSKVNYCFYPIISSSHPFIQGLAELEEKHGSLDNVPDDSMFPEIDSFAILVKTHSFKTVGAIPDDFGKKSSVEGLVINQIDSLDSEEEELLLSSFPDLDLDKVLILEDGRKPASTAKSFGLMGGGAIVLLLGVGGLALAAKN